jgi:hypothetical protein
MYPWKLGLTGGRSPAKRCHHLASPLPPLQPSRAFRLTPGQVWSTDTPSTIPVSGACGGAPGRARPDPFHSCAGGRSYALPTLPARQPRGAPLLRRMWGAASICSPRRRVDLDAEADDHRTVPYASAPALAQAHPLGARRLGAPARHGLPSSAPGHRPHSSPSRSIPIDVDGTLGDRREAGSEVSARTGCNPSHGPAPVVRKAVCCIRTLPGISRRAPRRTSANSWSRSSSSWDA